MNPRTNRRDFLKAGSLLALPYFVPSTVLGAPGKPGANDKVQIGVIGLGGRATDLVKNAVLPVSDAWVVAVCDCLKSRCERFVQAVQPDAKWGMYDDLGAMFEKEKLDAVMVETTTHARAWTTVHAMLAGMDVYIEKPMALTIAEGREMVDVARKQNVHAEAYFAGLKRLPKRMPGSYSRGSKEEAMIAWEIMRPAWKKHPEAHAWMIGQCEK